VNDIKEVRTGRLVITDEEGRERIQFGTFEGGAMCMKMLDASGMPKMTLAMDKAGDPFLCMFRPGNVGLLLAIKDGGDPGLALCDPRGEIRALLALDSKGHPSLNLSNEKMEQVSVEVAGREGAPAADPNQGGTGGGDDC